MNILDRALDAALIGYSKIGFSLRRLSATEQFPSLDGKTFVVSGATGGIGKATACRMVANGATVHIIGRSESKLTALAESTDGNIVPHQADLSSMAKTAEVAAEIRDAVGTLDGIVNNVGVMSSTRSETVEGFEMSYATNLLGQYILTETLRPKLTEGARVVFVSSGGMYSQPLTASNIESVKGEFTGTNSYARTKRGQVVLAEELNRRPEYANASVVSMHPGWVDTDGVKESLPTFRRLTRPVLRDGDQGADTIVWLLGSESIIDGGEFYHDRQPRPQHRLSKTKTSTDVRSAFIAKLESDSLPYLS